MKRRVVTLATMKGGSGKSTIAVCLAAHWWHRGRRVALIDADPQRSVIRWRDAGTTLTDVDCVAADGTSISAVIRDLLDRDFERVVVDTPGFRAPATDAALEMAGLCLIPVRPSPVDFEVAADEVERIADLKARGSEGPIAYRFVLSQLVPGSVIARHMRAEMEAAGYLLLASEAAHRVAYAETALIGSTPTLAQPQSSAATEIREMAAEVDGFLDQEHQTNKKLPKLNRRAPAMESAPGPDDGSQSQATSSQDGTESPGACGPGPESTSLESAPEGAPQVDSEVHNPAGRDDEVQQRVARAMEVVRRRTNWAIAGGLLPIPGFDILAIAGVQLAMLRELSVHYGVPFQRNLAKSLTTTLLGSVLPYAVGAGLAGSIAKVMPVLGWGVGLAAVSALAGAATHATGLVFVQHFESGGTFLDFDPVATRDFFRREFDAARNRGGTPSAGSA